MRKRTHKQECPKCKNSDHTIIKNSKNKQFYCKNCDSYFTPNTNNPKYSARDSIIYNTIMRLFYPAIVKGTKFKEFVKTIKNENKNIPFNIQIVHKTITRQKTSTQEAKIRVDGNLANSIIITRSGDNFIITKGLDVRQKILFNDFAISTFSEGHIKRDYHLFERNYYEEEDAEIEEYDDEQEGSEFD